MVGSFELVGPNGTVRSAQYLFSRLIKPNETVESSLPFGPNNVPVNSKTAHPHRAFESR